MALCWCNAAQLRRSNACGCNAKHKSYLPIHLESMKKGLSRGIELVRIRALSHRLQGAPRMLARINHQKETAPARREPELSP